MSSPRLNFFCPCCGEDIVLVLDEEFVLHPGRTEFTCFQCKTHFLVKIEFREIEGEG